MPVFRLHPREVIFPDSNQFDTDGDIVAIGGDLNPARIIEAYCRGIFPWYNTPKQYLWFCPKVRSVLFTERVHISHNMKRLMKRGTYRCTVDTQFELVIEGCRSGSRKGNTWIHDEIVEAYTALHNSGYCHSVEVWYEDQLAGGLYGSSLGRLFFGESMFSIKPDASKFALIWLAQRLGSMGWPAIDCQVPTQHLASLGAVEMPREEFLNLLNVELMNSSLVGKWTELPCFANP